MSFDKGLAERLRALLESERDISEKQMFGGLAFMSCGYMFVGILGDVLMARVARINTSRHYPRFMFGKWISVANP